MTESLAQQAENLAAFLAGYLASTVVKASGELFEGETKVERTGDSSFTITTRSGTVVDVRLSPLEAGT